MIRVLVVSLLLGAAPLAAQPSTADVPPLRSGTQARVFLRDGPTVGATGWLVSGTRDTVRLASPSLGLVRLSAADLQRLEVPAASGPVWQVSAIDPRLGLPEVRQNPDRPGVPVRILAGVQPRATQRMHGFSADSLYLFAEGRSTTVARADVRSLQVSAGRDRWSGVMWGAAIGTVAGTLVGVTSRGEADEGSYLSGPPGGAIGAAVGGLVGVAVGWVLAPRKWEHVPLLGRRR